MPAKKKTNSKTEQKFEVALSELEEIVEKLETENVDIDEAFKYFEKGLKLSNYCAQKLSGYERKIKIAKLGESDDGDSGKEEVRLELFEGVEEENE